MIVSCSDGSTFCRKDLQRSSLSSLESCLENPRGSLMKRSCFLCEYVSSMLVVLSYNPFSSVSFMFSSFV